MKFNLKNFPKETDFKVHVEWKIALDVWFVGFEKELREKLADRDCQGFNFNIELIKEILGE